MKKLAALAICIAASGAANAATYTWNGSAGNLWSNPANWTPAAVPQAGASLVFTAWTQGAVVNDLNAGTSFTIQADCQCEIHGNEISSSNIRGQWLKMYAPLRFNGNGTYYFHESHGPIEVGPFQARLDVGAIHGPLSGSGTIAGSLWNVPWNLEPSSGMFLRGTHSFTGTLKTSQLLLESADLRHASIVTPRLSGSGVVGPVSHPSGRVEVAPSPRLETGSIAIDGFVAHYQNQLAAKGAVTLGERASFFLLGYPPPRGGQVFTLIDNDGTEPVQGTFLGMPEGATDDAYQSIGVRYRVSYRGGDGNDVTMAVIADPAFTPLDLGGQGRSDVLWYNGDTGAVYRLPVDGATPGAGYEVFREPDLSWRIVGHGDFNGDGHADLLWRRRMTGEVYVQLYSEGRVAGGRVVHRELYLSPWLIALVADIDRDGKSDIVWRDEVTGEVRVLFMDGLTVASAATIHREPDTQWKIVGELRRSEAPAAILLWRHAVTGELYSQGISRDGSGWRAGGFTFYREPNLAWNVACTADLDRDGRADIVWQNADTGQAWGMHLLTSGFTPAVSHGPIHMPESPDWKIVACGDYNGDGHGDLLWRHAADGRVHVMLMGVQGSNRMAAVGGGVVHVEPDPDWRVVGVNRGEDWPWGAPPRKVGTQ